MGDPESFFKHDYGFNAIPSIHLSIIKLSMQNKVKKVSEQRKPRPACACAQSDQAFHVTIYIYLVFIHCIPEQMRRLVLFFASSIYITVLFFYRARSIFI